MTEAKEKIYVIQDIDFTDGRSYARENWFDVTRWYQSSDREMLFSTEKLANKYLRKLREGLPESKKKRFIVKQCEKEELFDEITKYIDDL